MSISSIAIIWWGAAGMMVAASILESEENKKSKPTIHLFEKNSRLGAKVIISGWGRCNVTTGTFKRKELLTYYTRGADFLDTAFRAFGPKKVRKRFEDHGVPLKQEDDWRIFPISDDGKDIVGIFENLFSAHEVQLHFKEPVANIAKHQNGFTVKTAENTYDCTHVVIATWGEAYAHTGSTWDGYHFAREMWHTITPLGPSLNSFVCTQERVHACSGISFDHAQVCLDPIYNEQRIPSSSGPVLLTHFGVTWPQTFVFASHCAFRAIHIDTPLYVILQIDTTKSYEYRNSFFQEHKSLSPKKSLINIIALLLPKRFVEHLLSEYQFPKTLTMSDLSKADIKQLTDLLVHGIPLTLTKRRPWDEFVTAWGVVTDEVDPTTMESKLAKGLYFVGEILNVDGVTGGYNLQASWAMGKLAWEAIATSK